MVQQLRVLGVLLKEPDSVLSTHMATCNLSKTPVPGCLDSLLRSLDTSYTWPTDILKANIHTPISSGGKKDKIKKEKKKALGI